MRVYKREFNSQTAPGRKTLLRWLAQFRTLGDLQNQDRTARDGTISTERYLEVLQKFWNALLASERRSAWFQQDGASFHCSIASLAWIIEHLNNRIIIRRLDTFWGPHSSDLSPPDFYLWGYLKGKVSANKPRTISQLKKNFEDEIRAIPVSMKKDVISKRIGVCITRKGAHLEHVLKWRLDARIGSKQIPQRFSNQICLFY